MHWHRRTHPAWLLAVALLTLPHAVVAAPAAFSVAPGGDWSVWQAESASGGSPDAWATSTPSGSGARYVQPQSDAAVLEFPFSLDRTELLRIKPIWWPTGEQKLATRFPYPLVRQPGPDAIGAVGTTVFTTAPAAGRVIAIDANTEQVLGATEVGGYLSDLVTDPDKGRVYVADALGDRVVGIDAKTRQVLGAASVPGGPWALAYTQGKLFVACREGKKLLAFDTSTGKVLKEIALSANPINLEVAADPSPRLIVRYEQQAFDVFTLAPAPAGQAQFKESAPRRRGPTTNSTVAGKPEPGCGSPTCVYTELAGPHTLARVTVKDGSRQLIDTSQVTKGPCDPEIVRRFGENLGPANPVHVTTPGDTPEYFVGFTSPSRGLVGIMEADRHTFRTVKVGGYLSDLKEVDGKLVAFDAAGKRMVVIEAKAARIESERTLPGDPWLVMTVPDITQQRAGSTPPAPTNRLYVMCRGADGLVAVDLGAGKITLDGQPEDDGEHLTAIGTGDRPTGVLIGPEGRLYVADQSKNLVVLLNIATGTVESEFNVPGKPCQMSFVDTVAWQRPDPQLWPPAEVNRLYVACTGPDQLVAVDLATKQVVARAPLAGEPRGLTYVPPPDSGWWEVLADDRIPLALQPRIAVEPRPSVLDLTTLALSPAPPETPPAARWHDAAPVSVGGTTKQFAATDQLVVSGGKQSIDISALADPQLLPDRPLTAKDLPGSITISLDGGPDYDWAAGRWIAPDNELFLVNDSEEFWRHNAPAVRAGPGQHTLRVKAHSQFARLDAVAVRETPPLEVTISPEPRDVHGAVPLEAYQGVFYDQEPVLFSMALANRSDAALPVKARFTLANYLGETSEPIAPMSFPFGPRGGQVVPIRLSPKEMGRFTLTVTLDTPDGRLVKEMRFLRLPKLEHPRMFFRKEDIPAIQARIAQYPTLFRRYGDWLERMSQKEGRFPDRFLPPDMTAEACGSAAPANITNKAEATDQCGWRNYELGWRVLASELALNFLKPDSQVLKTKVEGLRAAEKVDPYCEFHHHGPFFPGVDASLLDLAPDPQRSAPKVYAQMVASIGDMNVLPWTLETLEEPLTPEKRALIWRIMNLEDNAERYFTTHSGEHGGTLWQNPYTWCNCPLHGYVLMFMFLHNIFGEPRLFEKPVFSGFLTFERYADPIQDSAELQPFRRGPDGEPWHWIFASLTKHPLEKSAYQWDAWLAKMNGPLPGDEQAAVDKLMALDGITLKGEMSGAANYFVSAVSVPMSLALGWYDPKAAQVSAQEAPPTALFDVEGWVTMRSGADSSATEVGFVSGVRDHTYRTKPNHFTINKLGHYLIGTPALLSDDGNNTGAWGNSVVVDDDWQSQWSMDLQHPRDGEHNVIDRFSPMAFTYLERDRLRFGYQASEGGFGGGLDLHGHTETLFMQEGRLLAYQTWPGLDFVAGDAANEWPVDRVSQLDRQLVFVKPNLVIVYDRVKLGPNGRTSQWIAATGPEVRAEGDSFAVHAGSAYLAGRALLPQGALAATPPPFEPGWIWKGQKLLTIHPAQQTSETEYLVVMRVGGSSQPLPEMRLIHDAQTAGVALTVDGREVTVRLHRAGPVGGRVEVIQSGRTDRYDLREAVEDTYRNWKSDPRYEHWVREARFGFVVPKGDRR